MSSKQKVKTAREIRAEYSKKLNEQRRKGTLLSSTSSSSTKKRIPLSSINTNRTRIQHQNKDISKSTSSSLLVKRTQSKTRPIRVTSKFQKTALNTTRPISKVKSQITADKISDSRRQEILDLKKSIQRYSKQNNLIITRIDETNEKLEKLSSDIELTMSELSDCKNKQIKLQGERDRIKNNVDICSETTKSLQDTLKDTRERYTLQYDNEQVKYDNLSLKHSNLKDNYSLTNTKVQDINSNIILQEKQLSNGKISLETLKQKLEDSNKQNDEYSNIISSNQLKIESYEEQIKQLEEIAKNDELIRRKLHNTILDLKGTVRVFIRVLNTSNNKDNNIFSYPDSWRGQTLQINPNIVIKKMLQFDFDKVFSHLILNNEIFKELDSLLSCCVYGDSVNIFTYNNILENISSLYSSSQYRELIIYSLSYILSKIHELETNNWKYSLGIQCLYINNNNCISIINEEESNENLYSIHSQLFSNIPCISINNINDFINIIDNFNNSNTIDDSSILFKVEIKGINQSTNETNSGSLHIISLSSDKSINDKNTTSILLNIITSLANKEHSIPFRKSKLSSLLRNSLISTLKTLFIINISNSEDNIESNLSLLRLGKELNSCNIGSTGNTINHKNNKKK